MSNNSTDLPQDFKREQSLVQLSQIYSKIQLLQLPQQEFSTDNLHQLSLLAEYSIHPFFSSPEIHRFHLKLTEKYWTKFQQLKNKSYLKIQPKRYLVTPQDDNQHLNQNKITEIDQKPIEIQTKIRENQESISVEKQEPTEAISQEVKQVKQVQLQLKVSKTYKEIQKFLSQFDQDKVDQKNPIKAKILLLNSWTTIPCKIANLATKKPTQSPCKIDSATYLENLKLGKNNRKDSNNIQSSKTIILGKNESTETKQIKHMLKIQAKTNFVEEKQKEESNLDEIQKKSIELNYLLNIITKEFFDDFFGDILKIIRENGKTIQCLCQQLIQKVKEQHNFIEIYVELIKKLTKSSLGPAENKTDEKAKDSNKFNALQKFLVAFLQQSFIKLISTEIQPSCSNFNEYKYQKQITGMCKFIGKLIKERILSKKIFKVCFWQIVYRYVQKVKEKPQNDIVNECLIEGIVIISNAMGPIELQKLIEKEKECKIIQNDQVALISRFEEMMNALVCPNDEDHVAREEAYKGLIDSVKVEEYPHILIGLMQIFGSKRMKLQFLIEQWQKNLEKIRSASVQNLDRLEQSQNAKRQKSETIEQVSSNEEDLSEIKKEIHEFVSEIKFQTENKKDSKQLIDSSIKKHENIMKQLINSKQSSESNQKIFKLLVIEFFNEFADCKHFEVVQERANYILNFAKSLGIKQNVHTLLLDIICKEEIENLMIIECDFHFLVDGLCLILIDLMHKAQVTQEEVQEKMKSSYDPEDEDMNEFFEKIRNRLAKLWVNEKRKLSQDEVFED